MCLQARAAFLQNANLATEDELMRAVYKGRWWVKEMVGVIQLKKYRALRKRYNNEGEGVHTGSGHPPPLDYHGQDAPSAPKGGAPPPASTA